MSSVNPKEAGRAPLVLSNARGMLSLLLPLYYVGSCDRCYRTMGVLW